jgi:uncharacterized membrane protein
MPSTASSLLALTIVSLGVLGIILSFLVPDRKNSRVAVVLSLLIIFVGGYEFVAQAVRQYMWQKKLDEIRQQQAVNLDQLKSRLQQGQSGSPVTSGLGNSK